MNNLTYDEETQTFTFKVQFTLHAYNQWKSTTAYDVYEELGRIMAFELQETLKLLEEQSNGS